jgi:cytoskeleton protein RodZ
VTDDVVTNAKAQVATPADLAAAREARGMSQVDISQRIKLQVRQVNALEEGQWDALPGKSFVRGALRSYGKLLDVDVTALLDSIGGFAEPAEVQGMRPLDSAISRSSGLGLNGGGRGSPILWVIAGLIGVVALVLYFGTDQDTTRFRSWLPSKTPAPAPADPAPATAPATPATGASPSSAVVPGSGSQPASPSSMLPSSSSAPSTPSPSQSPVASAPGGSTSAPASGANSAAAAAGSGPVLSALSVLPRAGDPATAAATAPTTTIAPAAASTAPDAGGNAAVATPPSRPASAVLAAATTGSEAAVSPSARAAPNGASPAGTAGTAGTVGSAGSAVAAASVAAAGVKGVIRLKAVGQDSWVEVRQADGTALHNGLIKSGDSVDLSGKPPYRLVLGNASHLELVYEGRAQDLAPHMRANNIARLQLP